MVLSTSILMTSRLLKMVKAKIRSHVPQLNILSIHSPTTLLHDTACSALFTTCSFSDEVTILIAFEDLVTLMSIVVRFSICALI